ncbi:TPA: hypothetical protein ACUA4C_004816 [Escherichia coli]
MAHHERQELSIESAQEQMVRIGRFNQMLAMEGALKMVFHNQAQKKPIQPVRGGCPAFECWVNCLKRGERLPRGKYFRSCKFIE